jgi:twitching motility protein PilT
MKILDMAINRNATDIHFQAGQKPILRIAGQLLQVDDVPVFHTIEVENEFSDYMNDLQKAHLKKHGNTDFAFSYGHDYRFRVNAFRQIGGLSMSLRLIRNKILSFEQLNLPPVFRAIAENYRQGFFLIVGPTGVGKSTSLASVLNHINSIYEAHIVTIEDPVEYVFINNKSLIDQIEVGTHVTDFQTALRACMRQDPDVIMIGEMRDYETIQAAITLAETGHLVFSTLHANNSVQTIDRIIDTFPEQKQKQIRIQLASTLTGIISQRLVPGVKENELVFAYEQLLTNDAVRNVIRSEKIEQLYNALQSSKEGGMLRLEQCLAQLAKDGRISRENAYSYAVNRELVDVFLNY